MADAAVSENHRRRLRYLPHWGSGPAKKAGSIALTAVLVLSNLLSGLSPAIAYAEELEPTETIAEVVPVEPVQDAQEEVVVLEEPTPDPSPAPAAPAAVVEEQPELPDTSGDLGEPVAVPSDVADTEEEGNIPDGNAPPAEEAQVPEAVEGEEEPKLPEVPATVDVEYKMVEGEDEAVTVEAASAVAGDPANRIQLKADFGIEDGKDYSVEVKVESEGADITQKVTVAVDKSYVDVPNDIDLAKVAVKVTVTVETPGTDEVPVETPEPVADGTETEPTDDAVADETNDGAPAEGDDAADGIDAEPTPEPEGEPSGPVAEPADNGDDAAEDETEAPSIDNLKPEELPAVVRVSYVQADADNKTDVVYTPVTDNGDGTFIVPIDSIALGNRCIVGTAALRPSDGVALSGCITFDPDSNVLIVSGADIADIEIAVYSNSMLTVATNPVRLKAAPLKAASGTITVVRIEDVPNSTVGHYFFLSDGTHGYCADSNLATPGLGTYSVQQASQVFNAWTARALDYLMYAADTSEYSGSYMQYVVQMAIWVILEGYDTSGYSERGGMAQSLASVARSYANGSSTNHSGISRIAYTGAATQRLLVTGGSEDGYAAVKKVSSNPSVTDGNPAYSRANALYGLYWSEADANADSSRIATFQTDANGDSNVVTLIPGTYYVKEVQASQGFDKDPTVHPVTVEPNETATVTSTEPYKTSPVSLVKVSSDPAATDGRSAYSKAGAVYGVYTDSSLSAASQVGTLTATTDGTTNTLNLPAGTYYVKETTAPSGFDLDTTVYSKTLAPGESWTITSTDPYKPAKAYLVKVSANPTLTEALPNCYSLAGAEYGVYASMADANADANRLKTLTTDATGKTNTVELPADTYYVKETKASKGYYLDQAVKTVTLAPGQTTTVNSTEQPGNDPARFTVQKVDRDTNGTAPVGGAKLEGAQYTVKYYGNTEGNTNGSPTRTWILKTNANGIAALGPNYLVEGSDELYMFGGTYGLPVGTVTVQETLAPEGYDVNDEIHKFIIKVNGDMTSVNTVNDGEAIRSVETIKRGDVRWLKLDSDGEPMANVPFEITGPQGDSVVVRTDANGVFDSSRAADKAQAWMPAGTEVDATRGAFPYGTYTVKELREVGINEGMVLVDDFSFTVDDATAGTVQDFRWMVNRPVEIATTLVEQRGGHYLPAIGEVTLVDTISYSGIDTREGATYWFEGTLMDKNSGESTGITAKGAEFHPTRRVGTSTVAFTADASQLAGKTIVAYETLRLVGDNVFIVTHEDINDVDQTVYFPGIGTTLLSEEGTHEALVDDPITLIDTIAYTNLEPGVEHSVTGELYDKETGESTGITASATFTPTEPNGTVDIEFTFDGIEWVNHELVAFETVTRDGRTWAVHADIDDVDQTVKIVPPEIKTSFAEEDGVREALAETPLTLVDTVSYKQLKPGQPYTMSAELYDKATGESIGITAETTFTPEESEGAVDVEFVIDDPTLVLGRYVVCFETLLYEGRELAIHADITDEDQTVNVPKIGTTMVDADGEHESVRTDETIVLTDTVEYAGLRVGETYTMSAELIDKATESVIATAETEFTAESEDGTVDVVFEVPYEDVRGKVTVAFETLIREGREVAIHADIEDEGQTVNFPGGGTTLTDETGAKSALAAQPMTLIDTISYRGLMPGKTYTATGELMDKATGESTGIVSEPVEFTPTEPDGEVEVEFTFDGFEWMGSELVAFETVTRDGRDVFVHADLEDEDQTVEIPEVEIKTTLADVDGNHEVLATEPIVLVDTVEYKNLKPGVEYKMVGELMDKATGESIGATAETTFTPETAEGTVEVIFEIDPALVEGTTLVAFEELFFKETSIAVHADIDDVDQTVTVPKIRTTLTDAEGTKDVVSAGPITLIDTVTYTNLVPGRGYVVRGELMDKATGEKLGIFSFTALTPEEADGTVELEFAIDDASVLKGKTVVAFETVTHMGREVAIHADLEDEAQTVHFPEIRTKATGDNGTKRVLATANATITDTVTYKNLVPGTEYKMVGTLMDKATGEPIGVTAETVFTPTEPNGTVEIVFTFDASKLSGHSVVVFESLYKGDVLVAVHADINDVDQTVELYSLPATGDMTNMGNIFALVALGMMLAVLGLWMGRGEGLAPAEGIRAAFDTFADKAVRGYTRVSRAAKRIVRRTQARR